MTNRPLMPNAASACALLMCSALLLTCGQAVRADVNVTIRGTIVAPPSCVINGGSTLTVPFGDNLLTTRIDGIEYRRAVPFTVTPESEMESAAGDVRAPLELKVKEVPTLVHSGSVPVADESLW